MEAERGKLRKSVSDRLDYSAAKLSTLQDKHHKLAVTCVAVSPDGHNLYTASKDKVRSVYRIRKYPPSPGEKGTYLLKEKRDL